MCPPRRPPTAIARSRLTGAPAAAADRLVRLSVSGTSSTVNVPSVPAARSLSASMTVRQTPLTAIESPWCASEVTVRPRTVSTTTSALSRTASTSPISSTIPVNTTASPSAPRSAQPAPGRRRYPPGRGSRRPPAVRRRLDDLLAQGADGGLRPVGAVDGRAGHEAVHPGFGGGRDGVGVDPAVDLHQQGQVPGVDHAPGRADLVQHLDHELL